VGEFIFEKLDVYHKAVEFADKIFSASKNFNMKHQSSLGDQLRRSALSIANNIAEGTGRKHKREKKQFFQMSLSSAYECIPPLKIALMQNELSAEHYKSLYQECHLITKMLASLVKSVERLEK